MLTQAYSLRIVSIERLLVNNMSTSAQYFFLHTAERVTKFTLKILKSFENAKYFDGKLKLPIVSSYSLLSSGNYFAVC